MNTPATEEAIKLAREGEYEDRLCLHLNLSHGRPLTNELRSTKYCDENGNIRKMKHRKMLFVCLSSSKVRKALRAECEAQLKSFRDNGFKSKHIDSHTWCMCTIPVWNAIKPILKKYGFETTRTMEGHRLTSCGIAMKSYYRFVFKSIKKNLKLIDDWAGCANELERDCKNGVVTENTRAELYVHPDMQLFDAVDTLYSYNHEVKPLYDIVKIADAHGKLNDII
jgi:predicted glycoside hydrolase/deacetylase ChbG (UPF0249 family)